MISEYLNVFFQHSLGFYVWIGISSVCAVSATLLDKTLAVTKSKSRISEKTLFFIALAGGSVSMLLTMLAIRHKTKHKRFMAGLPIIIFFQIAVVFFIKNRF